MEKNDINQLVNTNLNYVKSLANKYKGKNVDFEDLVSEGNMAMVQAARKFDASRGTTFVAYAAPFIKKAMEKAIKQQETLYRIPKEEYKKHPHNFQKARSIDAPLGTGNQYTLLDILVNYDTELSDNRAITTQLVKELNDCIKLLDEREQEVIRKFYGLGTPHITLAEIAIEMKIKRERARQIRDKAIRNIARNSKSKILKYFLHR